MADEPQTQILENILDELTHWLQQEQLLWKLGLALIGLAVLYWLLISLVRRRSRRWASLYYTLLCASVLLWTGGTLLPLLKPGFGTPAVWAALAQTGALFVLVLLCLALPAAYLPLVFFGRIPYGANYALAFGSYLPPTGTWGLLYLVYAVATLLKGTLLCLNVFYQMPRHMRRSTYYLLSGIAVYAVAQFALLVFPDLPVDLPLIASAIMLLCFYDAFFANNSANVVVTSRDFVFGSLSTMILVLSRTGRVLDWNKKSEQALSFLPKPAYREPFTRYRQRMLDEGNGRVSPHGDNIITTTHGDAETHYLITTHEVKNRSRALGSIVEIAEVTKIYSVLRYLEDIAMVDQLTGLYNRNAYLNIVRRLMAEDIVPLVVVVGDVNGLKRLNDTCGHLIGDSLLMTVSEAIKQAIPQNSYACRIGGDEFVLLLPGASLQNATDFIQEVNTACAAVHDRQFGSPSISWGYAVRSSMEEDYNDVFAQADQMMYLIKKQHFEFTSSGIVPADNLPLSAKGGGGNGPDEDAGIPPATPAQPVQAETGAHAQTNGGANVSAPSASPVAQNAPPRTANRSSAAPAAPKPATPASPPTAHHAPAQPDAPPPKIDEVDEILAELRKKEDNGPLR